jgi:carbonic anhydrase
MCKSCELAGIAPSTSLSKRRFLATLTMAVASMALGGAVSAKHLKAPPKPQNIVTPDQALERLRQGNTRYV